MGFQLSNTIFGSSVEVALTDIQLLLSDMQYSEPEAYWHPFGFFRIELGEREPGMRHAIHVWPEGPRRDQGSEFSIHRHPWHLDSFVFCGSLINTLYEVNLETPTGLSVYASSVVSGASSLVRTGSTGTILAASSTVQNAGTFYSVSDDTFHSTEVGECLPTATYIRRSFPTAEHGLVLATYGTQSGLGFKRKKVEPKTLRREINQISATLEEREERSLR